MGFGRLASVLLFMSIVLTPFVFSLSFIASPDITPDYPSRLDGLSCAWTASADTTGTTLYWYINGVLDRTINNPTSPQTIRKQDTSDGQTWTCAVAITDGSSTLTESDYVVIGSTNVPPTISSIELNEVGDSGDNNITLAGTGTTAVRCFGTATDANGNDKVQSVVGTIYASGSGITYADPDDFANHYTDSTCEYNQTTGAYTCLFDVWYFATGGIWTCQVDVTDEAANTGVATDTATVAATNFLPTIDSLEFNEVGDSGDNQITLSSLGTQAVRCFGTASDLNGNADIQSIDATFYHDSVSWSSPDNFSNHYTNSSCTYNEFTENFECSTAIWHYATNGTWYCNVSVYDEEDHSHTIDSVFVNSGTPPDVSFTTYPEILPSYPPRQENLVCSWGESADVETATVYWYVNGILFTTEYPTGTSSTISSTNTKNGEEWNCTVYIQAGDNAYNATGSDAVIIGSTPPSQPPSINSVLLDEINGNGDNTLTLVPGGAQGIRCYGSASDPDGLGDITSVTGAFYSANVNAFDPDNDRNHYSNNSCSYDNTTGDYFCSTNFLFYVDPGTWTCLITVKDKGNVTAIQTDTATVNTMLVMDIPDNSVLDFGAIGPGQSRTATDYVINVSNKGNVPIDLDVDAWLTGGGSTSTSAMSCTLGTIPIANMRVSQTFATYNLYTSLLASGYLRIDLNLDRQSTGTTIPWQYLYFGLSIPPSGSSGSCSGVVSLLGVSG